MKDLAKDIVNEAIDEVNLDQGESFQIINSPDTSLISASSSLDSLTLVRLLVAVERIVEEKTGKIITVVDEVAFEAEQSPFATVGTLQSHIEALLD